MPSYPGVGWRREERRKELRSLSGLEKAGVSDCRGHTDTETGSGVRLENSALFYARMLFMFRGPVCELMHVHRNTVQTTTDDIRHMEGPQPLRSHDLTTRAHTHTGVFPFLSHTEH